MADPKFNGVTLTSEASSNRIGSPQTRVYTETMPGLNGLFAQPHGIGGRDIEVEGLLTGFGAAAALARNAALAACRQRQQLADGATVATFTGVDGCAYSNCLLIQYAHGPVRVARLGSGSYAAYLPVRARLRQLTP